jgi:hypothetical protein
VGSYIYDKEKLRDISHKISENKIGFFKIQNDFHKFLSGQDFHKFCKTELGNQNHVKEYLKNALDHIGQIYGILHEDSQQSR